MKLAHVLWFYRLLREQCGHLLFHILRDLSLLPQWGNPYPSFTQHITLPSPPHSTHRALYSISPSLMAALGPLTCLATHPTNSPSTLEGWGPKQKPHQAPLLTIGLSESFVEWVKGSLSPVRSLETCLRPAPVTCHVSSCQGIPWTKVDYSDNGVICNLIEHVSYPSLISETSFLFQTD